MSQTEATLLDRVPVRRHRIDAAAYHRMAEVGILAADDRVELVEGQIVSMAPIGDDHAGTTRYLIHVLSRVVGDRALVDAGDPLRLDPFNEPQPDIVLLLPRADFYRRPPGPRAADTLLVIEVASTSLAIDRHVKRALYARYGVPEYWIIDLQGRAIEVHRAPSGDAYAEVRRAVPGETVSPASLPDVVLHVSEVLS